MFHVKQGSAPAPDLDLRRALEQRRDRSEPLLMVPIFRVLRHPYAGARPSRHTTVWLVIGLAILPTYVCH